jgi:lipopolysaccharide/colanic/teichoic acid biosynthesis glycosyltransferase
MLITAILVRVKLGSPVIFCQRRPGKIDSKTGKERIFKMYKFRSMTDERDENGELLSDEIRLSNFGKKLRSTSLDELPELFNVLKGDMSIVGPRPQLVRDMVFMTKKQRERHEVSPGLTGLAQVNGRNAISWEEKLNWDLKYKNKITFVNDLKLIIKTLVKVLSSIFGDKSCNVEIDITDDFGDALLKSGRITIDEYETKQQVAKELLGEEKNYVGTSCKRIV